MEQSDSISKVTPYELATLASRISPERCARDPVRALDDAAKLVHAAKFALWRAREDEKTWKHMNRAWPKAGQIGCTA